jgi:hypothetical protein
VEFDAALAPGPAGASGKPATTAPDNLFNVEFTGWSGVEALGISDCNQASCSLRCF